MKTGEKAYWTFGGIVSWGKWSIWKQSWDCWEKWNKPHCCWLLVFYFFVFKCEIIVIVMWNPCGYIVCGFYPIFWGNFGPFVISRDMSWIAEVFWPDWIHEPNFKYLGFGPKLSTVVLNACRMLLNATRRPIFSFYDVFIDYYMKSTWF